MKKIIYFAILVAAVFSSNVSAQSTILQSDKMRQDIIPIQNKTCVRCRNTHEGSVEIPPLLRAGFRIDTHCSF